MISFNILLRLIDETFSLKIYLFFPRLDGDYLDEISRLRNFQQMESWRTHLNNWGNAQISLAYANVG